MDNNNLEKFSDRKVGAKQLMVPTVLIFLLVLIVVGASYAYFGAYVTNNTINITAATPAKVNKTCTITKSDCSITVGMTDMYGNVSNNTTAKYSTNCSTTITCNGAVSDGCTYNVQLTNTGTTYTKTTGVTKEYTGTLSGAATKAETNMDSLGGTKIATSQSIAVATASTAVSKTYTLQVQWYNVENIDQKQHYGKTYGHQLKIVDLVCDMSH